jgi:hypothetical protein
MFIRCGNKIPKAARKLSGSFVALLRFRILLAIHLKANQRRRETSHLFVGELTY